MCNICIQTSWETHSWKIWKLEAICWKYWQFFGKLRQYLKTCGNLLIFAAVFVNLQQFKELEAIYRKLAAICRKLVTFFSKTCSNLLIFAAVFVKLQQFKELEAIYRKLATIFRTLATIFKNLQQFLENLRNNKNVRFSTNL